MWTKSFGFGVLSAAPNLPDKNIFAQLELSLLGKA